MNERRLTHRYGRVNYVLAKRMELLGQVDRLQRGLACGGDAGATCELAHHFHVYHVRPRWRAFQEQIAADKVTRPKTKVAYVLHQSSSDLAVKT